MEFTKEQLIAAACSRIDFAKQMLRENPLPLAKRKWEIELSLSEIALASLEAEAAVNTEPVAWVRYCSDGTIDGPLMNYQIEDCRKLTWTPLYAVKPAKTSIHDILTDMDALDGCREWLLSQEQAVNVGPVDGAHDVLIESSAGYLVRVVDACRAAMLQGADGKPELTVWYGSMPESNGKANWTAILHRKGEGRCMDGFTIDRSEYPGRVLYAADRVRYLIGEKSERPSILDYDADAHSGYVKPSNSPVIPDGWVLVPVEPTEDMIVNGFESEPDESFSDEKEWEAYEAMSGCQQAAHRAKLCWQSMIAAAPKN